MTTLDRYITGYALRTSLAVVMALLSLITLFALFEELDDSRANYGLAEASWYILQTTPRRLDEILVYGIFLGYLIALGRLAETNEITICRVSGISPTRLMFSLLPSMFLWLAFSVAIAEFVAPMSERSAQVDKLKAMWGEDALDHRGGLWVRSEDMYMRVRAIDEAGAIHGVQQYWLDENKALVETIQAQTATYDKIAQRWNLINGTRTLISDEGARIETFRARTWDNDITPELFAAQAFLEPNKMSVFDLQRQIEFGRTQLLGVSEYELAFWSRMLKPLTFIGLTLFALGVVLGPLRQVGMGVRLTVGIFAGLSFKYLQDLFAPAAIVFNIPALIAILIPIIAYWLVAIYLIRRNA